MPGFGGTSGRRNYGAQIESEWAGSQGQVVSSGPSFAQNQISGSGSLTTNKSVTLDTPPGVGSSLILCITVVNGNSVSGITGGGITTWALAVSVDDATTVHTEIWYGHTSDGSTGVISVTLALAGRSVIEVSEWQGLKNAAPESVNSNISVANATVTTNSVTPVSARSVTIAAGGWSINDYLSGPINSYTRLINTSVALTNQEEAYLIKTSASATSTGWGLTAAIDWTAVIAAFGAT